MNKINFPDINCDGFFSTCLLSVSRRKQGYKEKLTNISNLVEEEWSVFDRNINPKNLYRLSPCRIREPDQIIIENVTKKELMDLYSTYMCKQKSQSRKIYDLLRASSKNGICPLCGINGVATLDHYLPKSRYPLHSVNPRNLIPACENCNTGKGSGIFLSESEQTLYPYDDTNKFYSTDWITATIIKDEILTFEFFATPPDEWSQNERERVINHFEGYNLSQKYSINSAQFITTVITMIRTLLIAGDHTNVHEHFNNLASNVPANSTLRAMYRAVASDPVICRGDF
ncbi:HNH endonuclease [Klebsiella sp. CN_Kp100]|uniref:HNH endonuclease n=1 Tax=Klebsiella sp. CN_Kp100 TaxID=3153422 RepID=UPI0032B32B18